jgi:DNA-directed RNA polymerases I and III subunit RPAC1
MQVRRLLQQEKWSDCIQLQKNKTHFIFTIESTGAMTPAMLLEEAIDILSSKADRLAARL